MAAEGTDWVAVVDGERLLGWVAADSLDGDGAPVSEAEPRPFRAVVRADTSLKAALDVIVTSQTRVAVVVDGPAVGDGAVADAGAPGYLGVLTVDDLAEGITQ
jgi:hypothetical protein